MKAAEADVVHMYGGFRPSKAPVVTSVQAKKRWFSPRARVVSVSPIAREGFAVVPEAVEETYWPPVAGRRSPGYGGGFAATGDRLRPTVASIARPSLRPLIEQTLVRLHRTHEDIEWLAFEQPPSPEQFAGIDVWIDPATDASDFDGFVAEALVSGLPAVASRTPINDQRLEKGRTGWLVPPNDPNELAHAILSALFKPEVAQQKSEAARQTMAKFRARHRLRILSSLYRSLYP